MNYIVADSAISIFAHATLVSYHSFLIEGNYVWDHLQIPNSGVYTIAASEGGKGALSFTIVPGPPINDQVHPKIQVGRRYVGDKHCLVVPTSYPGEFR